MSDQTIERVELGRMAISLGPVVEYLDLRAQVAKAEGAPMGAIDALSARVRLVCRRLADLSVNLPEGPLEEFGREHPMYVDAIDGPYCGYGTAEGRPYTCPVGDPVRHWDAWELLGTRLRRPESAKRPPPQPQRPDPGRPETIG